MNLPLFADYYVSPIGTLEIAANQHFITGLVFIEEGQQPAPGISAGHQPENILLCRQQLDEYFNGTLKKFHIAFEQPGTIFQQKVWKELLELDFGSTISYMNLAKRLGDPKVIRAAATTNGKNKIALIVPCHRVIGSTGSLVGYAGGLWRKKWLLDHESKIAHGLRTLF